MAETAQTQAKKRNTSIELLLEKVIEAGKEIFVQRLGAAKDAAVEFDKVLLVDNEGAVKVGSPYVEGAVVKATVLDEMVKGDKVLVFKKIRRKGYQPCKYRS